MNRIKHRLRLDSETIRVLSGIDLARAAGGAIATSVTDEGGRCCFTNKTCYTDCFQGTCG